jgi:hypothetical protein
MNKKRKGGMSKVKKPYLKSFLFLLVGFLISIGSFQGVAEDTRLIHVEGEVFLKGDSLYLIDQNSVVYQVTDKNNPKNYKKLYGQAQNNAEEGKGLAAVLIGRMGNYHSIINQSFHYPEEGGATAIGKEFMYKDFALVHIESITDSELIDAEDSRIYRSTSKPPIPKLMPALMKNIQGQVTNSNINSVVPYVEVRDLRNPDRYITVIIPAEVKVIRVKDQELYYTSKDNLKKTTKVEIWYSEEGDMNIAKSITLLPE